MHEKKTNRGAGSVHTNIHVHVQTVIECLTDLYLLFSALTLWQNVAYFTYLTEPN